MPGASRKAGVRGRSRSTPEPSTSEVEDPAAGASTPEASADDAPKAEPVKDRPRRKGSSDWPAPDPDAAAERPKAGRSRGAAGVLPWAVAAIAVAAAVVFAVLWQGAESGKRDAQATDHRRAAVVGAATQFLGALTNFRGETIDADVQRIRSYAVGDFADQVDRFFGPDNVAALKRAKVTSAGRVRSVYVQSISGPQASVFGVVDEAITNQTSAPRTDTLRIDVEMVETKDGWKVSSVQILQSPGSGPLG